MKILHFAFERSKVLIWSEVKVYAPQQVTLSKELKKNSQPKIHPFSADTNALSEALPHLSLDQEQFAKSLAWLPSMEETPLPSNNVLCEVTSIESPRIIPWAIWTCEFPQEKLLEWVLGLNKKDMVTPGIFVGKEFVYLTELCYFSLSLAIRQRYIPSIRQVENKFEAYFKPIFSGIDKERLCTLENSMPAICRAVSTSVKQKNCPQIAPQQILSDFITETLNHFVRSSHKESIDKVSKDSTIHDLWIQKLMAKNNVINRPADEFMGTIQEWQTPLFNTLSSPFKLCMRLEEPEEIAKTDSEASIETATSPWNVSYFLQAYDDPSLIVKTKDVWNPKGMKRKLLERPNFNARQFILTSLVMATELCPHIESSLQESIPLGFQLDSQQAFTFLQEESARLEDAGFGIICPPWWKRNKYSIKASGVISSPFQSKRKKSIWEDIKTDWKIYIGDLGLSEEELLELALLKDPIIKMRGEWVLLNKADIQKALNFLKNKPINPKNALDLLKLASGTSDSKTGIQIAGIEATGWVNDFLNAIKNNEPMQLLNPPSQFQGQLRPYQLRGYSWISFLKEWQLGACLADDMGLGKTPQTLAMLTNDWVESDTPEPSLLICPTSLTGNWSREAAKFAPQLPIHIHYGNQRQKGPEFANQVKNSALVITSYATLLRDYKLFSDIKWRGIILDEAQNIKNSETKQTQAIHTLKSDYRLALTGTPVENNVGDLWSIMHFLNPGYLGSKEIFRTRFFNPIQLDRDTETTERLKGLTKPLILRRLKTDRSIITDLPDKIETKVYCQLTPEQISLYEHAVADANHLLETSSHKERNGIVLATLSKLKQICNHPTNYLDDNSEIHNRSGKLSRLLEIIEETQLSKERCLLFTQYTTMGHLLKNYFEERLGKEVLFLHGGTLKKHRDEMVERFQKDDDSPTLFILSLKAGGVGLNLTRACHVFHYDRWWNPAIENQATDRAFRIGQTKNVQVHKFICTGTIEERIDEMIESKKEVAANVVGTGEDWLTQLSTESLKELWKLQRSVID